MLNIFQILIIQDSYFKKSQLTNLKQPCKFYSFITDSSSATVENTTDFYSPKKTQSKRNTTLVLATLGLTVVFLIMILMYIFTGLLEKCIVKTNTI